MAFNPPPAILQKVLAFKAIKHEDGKFLLWGIPCFISQMYSFAYLQKYLSENIGEKQMIETLYNLGHFQAKEGFKLITERFGYAETIKDKAELLKFNIGQGAVIGIGIFEWKKIDFENKIFIMSGKTNMGEEIKNIFGFQKEPVDHFLRGEVNAFIEEILKEKTMAIETKCIARGDKECEYIIKPVDNWDKNDPLVKKQWVERIYEIEEIGAKKKPYLSKQ